MNIYIVYERDYGYFKTGLCDNVEFYGAYKSRKKAMRKAKELMKNVQKDNLIIDNTVINKKNPFKKDNWVDFYNNDDKSQDNVITSIIMEETKLIA